MLALRFWEFATAPAMAPAPVEQLPIPAPPTAPAMAPTPFEQLPIPATAVAVAPTSAQQPTAPLAAEQAKAPIPAPPADPSPAPAPAQEVAKHEQPTAVVPEAAVPMDCGGGVTDAELLALGRGVPKPAGLPEPKASAPAPAPPVEKKKKQVFGRLATPQQQQVAAVNTDQEAVSI